MRRLCACVVVPIVVLAGASCHPADVTSPEAAIAAHAPAALLGPAPLTVTVTVLPDFGYGHGDALDINDLGQVLIDAWTAPGPSPRPAVWTAGGGLVMLALPDGNSTAHAYAINNAGDIVGGTGSPPTTPLKSVRWSPAGEVASVIPVPSVLLGLNEFGWAVGPAYKVSPADVPTPLAVPGCAFGTACLSSAWGINNRGQVSGSFGRTATREQRLARWEPDGSLTDLGSLGGIIQSARGINEAGDVVGRAEVPTRITHAFVWTDESGLRDLGASPFADGCPGLNAQDISDHDEVVGSSYPSPGSGPPTCQQVPYYWSEATGFVRLPMPRGFESLIAFPRRINNRRQIVGYLGIQEFPVLWEIHETCASDAAGIVTQLLGIVDGWQGAGVLSQGRATALGAKLLAAARGLAAGQATPARGQISAFLNELRAFATTGLLTADDTRVSFTCAERALEQLGSE